ncbi:MAG: hypothetical protein ACOC3U_02005 [Thiohalospira sp.]
MVGAVLVLAASMVEGAEWDFEEARTLHETEEGQRVILAGPGGARLALRGDHLMAVWTEREGGRTTATRFLHAALEEGKPSFDEPERVTSAARAAEPVVAPVGGEGNFILAWRESDQVRARLWRDGALAPPLPVTRGEAAELTLASVGREALLVWGRPGEEWQRLAGARLRMTERRQLERDWLGELTEQRRPGGQRTPALAGAGEGAVLLFNQIRDRHTRLYITRNAEPGEAFGEASPLNPLPSESRGAIGRGPRIQAPVVASDGDRRVAGLWLERRGDGVGPRLQTVHSDDGGRSFPRVEPLLGEEPERAQRAEPDMALSSLGLVVAVWRHQEVDEEGRTSGDPGLRLAVREGEEGWGEPRELPGCRTDRGCREPLVELDGSGNAHFVWLEGAPDGGMALRYQRATLSPDDG